MSGATNSNGGARRVNASAESLAKVCGDAMVMLLKNTHPSLMPHETRLQRGLQLLGKTDLATEALRKRTSYAPPQLVPSIVSCRGRHTAKSELRCAELPSLFHTLLGCVRCMGSVQLSLSCIAQRGALTDCSAGFLVAPDVWAHIAGP